ncbi:MAG: GWxTD domain-containing protein [Granulosicoccus sp.]|jgi:GWxTD domain-containing protein
MRFTYLILVLLAMSFNDVMGGNVKALLSFARFSDPANGVYLESYLNINGQSLERISDNEGGFHAEVLVEITITKLGKEVYSDNYRVISPTAKDSTQKIADFVDIQRIPLKSGMHELTISFKDAADEFAVPATIVQPIKMSDSQKTYMSDLQIVSSMVKNENPNMYTKVGYDLIPYASDFYPETMKDLTFYMEFYPNKVDQNKNEEYVVDAYIVDSYSRMAVNNLRKYFKRDASEVGSVLHFFPIQNLASGNYILIVDLKNRENEKLDSREFTFQRSNNIFEPSDNGEEYVSTNFTSQYGDSKKLETYLRCYYPIAGPREENMIENQLNFNDLDQLHKFMYGFWNRRNPGDPEGEWMKYKKALDQVQVEYGDKRNHGCHTDRGRVYLQYGSPNSISKNYYEPASYPYEIWHYYHVEASNVISQNNVKFVFARMEQGLNNFNLLHSTGEGELNNPRWKLELHQRTQTFRDIDQEDTFDYHGGKATERFNNPY